MKNTAAAKAALCFLGLALIAIAAAQLDIVMAWVSYPIAVIAFVFTLGCGYEWALQRFAEDPPEPDPSGVGSGLLVLAWLVLAAWEVVALLIYWFVGTL